MDICKNRLGEAILTKIHNICFLEYWTQRSWISPLIHLFWTKHLFRLNCRYNESSRYIQYRYKEGWLYMYTAMLPPFYKREQFWWVPVCFDDNAFQTEICYKKKKNIVPYGGKFILFYMHRPLLKKESNMKEEFFFFFVFFFLQERK